LWAASRVGSGVNSEFQGLVAHDENAVLEIAEKRTANDLQDTSRDRNIGEREEKENV
jgi:hypothetical protein